MTPPRCEHFVEGELSMKVPLNNIYPAGISWLAIQFLNKQTHTDTHTEMISFYIFY